VIQLLTCALLALDSRFGREKADVSRAVALHLIINFEDHNPVFGGVLTTHRD
jgi:hypothetical protein